MFGRATIRLGIGPHSSYLILYLYVHVYCYGLRLSNLVKETTYLLDLKWASD